MEVKGQPKVPQKKAPSVESKGVMSRIGKTWSYITQFSFERKKIRRGAEDDAKGEEHQETGQGEEEEEDEEQKALEMLRQQRLTEMQASRPQLGASQMELIQMSWDIVQEDLAALGHGAFDRLFASHPEIKDSFGPFKELTKENAHFDKELRLHGVRVLRTVETILNCRHDVVRLIRLLHNLGRKHVKYSAKAEYFEIVGRQFLLAIEPVMGERWTPEVEQAWQDLFRFIAHIMEEAMLM